MEKLSANLCGLWGHPVDPPLGRPSDPMLTWADDVHRMCRRKTWRDFSEDYPQKYPQAAPACLWKTGAASRRAEVFAHIPDGFVGSVPSRAGPPAGSPSDRLRPASPLGYPSPVCSITGDAIGRIADAIDQLASDALGESGQTDQGALAARIADVWAMISALDPELARRRREYTAPADDAPST